LAYSRAISGLAISCRFVALLAATLLGLGAAADRAAAAIYWAGENGIGRANLDGEAVAPGFIGGSAAAYSCGVAADHAHIYWGNPGRSSIGRANLDGSGADPSFIAGADWPCAVSAGGGHVYWANTGRGFDGTTIGRANLDGSDVDQSFVDGAAGPCGIAVDDTHIYWSNAADGTIGRAELDGTGVQPGFITGAQRPCGLAVTGGAVVPDRHAVIGGHVYWANSGGFPPGTTIGRASLDGGAVDQSFMSGLHGAWDVAVTETHALWGSAGPDGWIGRAYLDGTAVDASFITQTGSVFGVFGIAVDQTSVTIRVGRPSKRRRGGTAMLPVSVPAPGLLELERTGRVRADAQHAVDAGHLTLIVAARRRARRQLESTGSVRVKARVSFAPEGATAITEAVSVRLVKD
jgi:virginiamycin B lyase